MDLSTTACTIYMHKFGGGWEAVRKHHFVDNHEKKEVLEQEADFLNEYKKLYNLGANFIQDKDKDLCLIVADWPQEELRHARGFGFGGSLHPERKKLYEWVVPMRVEPIVVIACDDEVCVSASEGELYCWRFAGMPKGATPAKGKGASRHVAGVATEVGNGRISFDHGGAQGTRAIAGGLTKMAAMKQYIRDKGAK